MVCPRKICLSMIATFAIIVYLCAAFFLDAGYHTKELALLFLVSCLAAIPFLPSICFEREAILFLLVIVAEVVIIFLVSPYSTMQLLRVCLLAATCFLLFRVIPWESEERTKGALGVFLWLSTLVIGVLFVGRILIPDIFLNHAITLGLLGADGAPFLPGAQDKNYTSLFVFLSFTLSWKRKFAPGVCLGLLYPLVYPGRQYVLTVVLFIAVDLFLNRGKGAIQWPKISTMKVLALFVAGALLVYGASCLWTEVALNQDVSSNKSSINDTSNAMRTSSTVYSVERIIQNPSFVLYGYDADLFEQMGISETTSKFGETYYVNDRFRLVQPHQEVINSLLKYGLVFTMAYYGLLSYLIARRLSRANFALFASYFLGSLLMHDVFTGPYLILFLFCLIGADLPPVCSRSDRALSFSKQPSSGREVRNKLIV